MFLLAHTLMVQDLLVLWLRWFFFLLEFSNPKKNFLDRGMLVQNFAADRECRTTLEWDRLNASGVWNQAWIGVWPSGFWYAKQYCDIHCVSEKDPSGSQCKCFEERMYYHVIVGKGSKFENPLGSILVTFCSFFVYFKSTFSANKNIWNNFTVYFDFFVKNAEQLCPESDWLLSRTSMFLQVLDWLFSSPTLVQ